MKAIRMLLAIFTVLPVIALLVHGIIRPKESFHFKNKFKTENVAESSEYELDIRLVQSVTFLVFMIAVFLVLIIY